VRALPTCLRPAPTTRRLEEPRLKTLGWSSSRPPARSWALRCPISEM